MLQSRTIIRMNAVGKLSKIIKSTNTFSDTVHLQGSNRIKSSLEHCLHVPAASWITKEEEGLIYKHEEAGVYGYFVQGAPCVVLRNLLTNRTADNGGNGTMYSLSLHHEEDEP